MSNQTYTSMYSRNAELYHHGIKGQKWGESNGPPYPLDRSISTGKKLKDAVSKLDGALNKIKKPKQKKDDIEKQKARLLKEEQKKLKKEMKRETVTSKAVKEAKKMTDEELRNALNRVTMEKRYAETVRDVTALNQQNPTAAKRIKNVIVKTAKKELSKTANTIVSSVTAELNKQISLAIKSSGEKDTKNKENTKQNQKSG